MRPSPHISLFARKAWESDWPLACWACSTRLIAMFSLPPAIATWTALIRTCPRPYGCALGGPVAVQRGNAGAPSHHRRYRNRPALPCDAGRCSRQDVEVLGICSHHRQHIAVQILLDHPQHVGATVALVQAPEDFAIAPDPFQIGVVTGGCGQPSRATSKCHHRRRARSSSRRR